jgi:peptidoglycan/LPS O-acetylase OafA/YrhL
MKYRSDIDGLRALAILPVVLFHTQIAGFSGGYVGVDIFFVISGYLICSLLTHELAANDFSLLRFYERRCRRLIPALFVMFMAVTAMAMFVLLPPDMEDFSQSLVYATAFLSNIYFWRSSSLYFVGSSEFKPLLNTWSLGVEEQFYIFTPLILFAIAKWLKSRYTPWLTLLALTSFTLSVLGLKYFPTINFYFLPTRFWELVIGALVAISIPQLEISRLARELIGLLGLALIVFSITTLSNVSPFPGWNALYPCLGAAIMIYIGGCGASVATGLLRIKPLVFLGKISYSLYLWHWPLLALARYQVASRDLTMLEISGLLSASLVLAVLSWRYVETPFRQKTSVFNARLIFKFTGAAIVCAVLIGLTGVYTKGFDFRYPSYANIAASGPERYNLKKCFMDVEQTFADWRGEECFLTKGNERRVLLWGDSFAAHYAPGLSDQTQNFPVTILQYTAALCPPIFDYYTATRPDCRAFNDNVFNILAKYNISTVVMSGRWESLFKRGVSPLDIAATVKRLSENGVTSYVIGQSPIFKNNVQTILRKENLEANTSEASASLSFSSDINESLNQALPAGTFINPLPRFCQDNSCKYLSKGEFLIFDFGHFTTYGSKFAVAGYFPFFSEK